MGLFGHSSSIQTSFYMPLKRVDSIVMIVFRCLHLRGRVKRIFYYEYFYRLKTTKMWLMIKYISFYWIAAGRIHKIAIFILFYKFACDMIQIFLRFVQQISFELTFCRFSSWIFLINNWKILISLCQTINFNKKICQKQNKKGIANKFCRQQDIRTLITVTQFVYYVC